MRGSDYLGYLRPNEVRREDKMDVHGRGQPLKFEHKSNDATVVQRQHIIEGVGIDDKNEIPRRRCQHDLARHKRHDGVCDDMHGDRRV